MEKKHAAHIRVKKLKSIRVHRKIEACANAVKQAYARVVRYQQIRKPSGISDSSTASAKVNTIPTMNVVCV